jgi:choline dehydrogenase-like flavoprotein
MTAFRGTVHFGPAENLCNEMGNVQLMFFRHMLENRFQQLVGQYFFIKQVGQFFEYRHATRPFIQAGFFDLRKEKKYKFGIPTVVFDADLRENEKKMRKDMMNDAAEMLEKSGLKNVKTHDNGSYLGMAIHEMGTARMGRDPKTSVLNGNNQLHSVKNVFVTDGAAMTSASCVNPSLTYMALTARAVDFAVKESKKKNI